MPALQSGLDSTTQPLARNTGLASIDGNVWGVHAGFTTATRDFRDAKFGERTAPPLRRVGEEEGEGNEREREWGRTAGSQQRHRTRARQMPVGAPAARAVTPPLHRLTVLLIPLQGRSTGAKAQAPLRAWPPGRRGSPVAAPIFLAPQAAPSNACPVLWTFRTYGSGLESAATSFRPACCPGIRDRHEDG